jgi:hypothetical protein
MFMCSMPMARDCDRNLSTRHRLCRQAGRHGAAIGFSHFCRLASANFDISTERVWALTPEPIALLNSDLDR